MTRKDAGIIAFRLSFLLCLLILFPALALGQNDPTPDPPYFPEDLAASCAYHTKSGQPYRFHYTVPPTTTTASRGPNLKIVTLGDSVVWGDGDKQPHKIVTLIAQALFNQTGRTVDIDVYAHSGARLRCNNKDATPKFPTFGIAQLGNLDAAFPSTAQQAICASTNTIDNDAKADYVLLDGCINEIGATNIAFPPISLGPILKPVLRSTIRTDVFAYCAIRMRTLLKTLLTAFPHARILLMNYYRVVSKDSTPKPFWNNAENEHEQDEVNKAIRNEKKFEHKHDPSIRANLTKAELSQAAQQWRTNSDEFLVDVTSCFRWAVDSANGNGSESIQPVKAPPAPPDAPTVPVCPTYTPQPWQTPPANPRISLVTFPDNDNYAYGAPQSKLWPLALPFFLGFSPNGDQLFFPRYWECVFHPFRGDLDCKVNPIAHPNPAGAACFSSSIVDVINGKQPPGKLCPAI